MSNAVSDTTNRIDPLLNDLAEGDPDEREEASETVVDWLSTLTRDEAARLGPALAAAAAKEKTAAAREAELNALGELAGRELLTRDDVLPLVAMGRPAPGATGREHLEYLDEEFALWPE